MWVCANAAGQGRRHLLDAAAIGDGDIFGTRTPRMHRGVDRRITAADDDDAPTPWQAREIRAWREGRYRATAVLTPARFHP